MAQFDTAVDFYQDFDKHPAEFATATTYAEYCALVGGPLHSDYLSTVRWAPAVFATAKAGKRTVRALTMPKAGKFSDLFSVVTLAETTGKGRAAVPAGGVYMGGDASLHGFFGGRRGWLGGRRRHEGTKFFGTYVTPQPELARTTLGGEKISSFEALRRADGILIIARDSPGIEGVWVALLDLAESIESYFSESTREFLRVERQAAVDAWGS